MTTTDARDPGNAPSPADHRRIAETLALLEAARAGGSGRPLAHLRIAAGGRTRDLLLGERSAPDAAVATLDWRRAPLAELYLAGAEGEAYSLEVDGRELLGTLLVRSTIEWRGDAVVGISGDEVSLRLDDREGWRVHSPPRLRAPTRPPAARRALAAPLALRLDPVQRAAVSAPASRHLLILGDAGHGKTTVALHRVAHLAAAAAAAGRPFRALVIVPGPGLRALCVRILDHLDVRGVEVATAEAWIAAQARRLYPELPRRLSGEDDEISRLKRSPALLAALPQVIARTPAMRDLKVGEERPPSARERLLHLFGDRSLLDQVIADSEGALGRRERDAVLRRTRIQFTATTEEAFAHVDAERLRTLDGRRIDEGTPLADAGSVDREDLAVVLELGFLATGADRTPHGSLTRYDHVVLDEAQELAPIEARILGRALRPGGSLSVAGDEAQQVDDAAFFTGWPARMRDLGAEDHDRVLLEVSYRCPPAIAAFARGVLDPAIAPATEPSDTLHFARFPHAAALHLALVLALAQARADDPRATIAIVCRHEAHARALHASLVRGLPVRFAGVGDVDFRPGVIVTSVRAVKGLEYDLVVLPDLEPAIYPDEARARRALYVAATRASAGLWLCTSGAWSPLCGVLGGAA